MKIFWILLALSCVSIPAAAGPLTWTLSGVVFNDGGTATGSFMFDAMTATYSSIQIVTTAGSNRAGATYSSFCAAPCTGLPPDATGILLLTQTSSSKLAGTSAFALLPANPLTGSGGIEPVFGIEADCSDDSCSGPSGATRTVAAGELIAPTPEPASAAFVGVVLAAFVLRRVWHQ